MNAYIYICIYIYIYMYTHVYIYIGAIDLLNKQGRDSRGDRRMKYPFLESGEPSLQDKEKRPFASGEETVSFCLCM